MMYFFFFNDTATTEIYTLSLHDALPISPSAPRLSVRACRYYSALLQQAPQRPQVLRVERIDVAPAPARRGLQLRRFKEQDRKSTRLNSSHANISYAVFCLKKKKRDYMPS